MKVKDLLDTYGVLKKEFVGRRIMIVKIIHQEDEYLEGRTGRLTYPFGAFTGAVGVWLDKKDGLTHDVCNLWYSDDIMFIKEE